jgi:hypothetical protein
MGLILLLAGAPLLQVMLINRSPWGGPDLVVLAVVWLALARGPVWGGVAGLAGGLAADVTPPADHTIGRDALILALTGLLAGLWREGRPLLVAAAGTALGTVLQGAAAIALGDEPWTGVVAELPKTLAWTVAGGSLVTAALFARRRRGQRTGETFEPRVVMRQVRRV